LIVDWPRGKIILAISLINVILTYLSLGQIIDNMMALYNEVQVPPDKLEKI
jgi:hypothetical protein